MIILACSYCHTLFLDALHPEGAACPHAIKQTRVVAGITVTEVVQCPGTLKPAVQIPAGAQYI